ADHDVIPWLDAALRVAKAHGGNWDGVRSSGPGGTDGTGRPGPGGRASEACGADRPGGAGQSARWRDSFLRVPYPRNAFPAVGVIAEPFESAVTWDAFPAFHERVTSAATDAARQICAPGAAVTCRFAFAYPDGPAPYYTVLAAGRRGEEADQWDAIKAAAS